MSSHDLEEIAETAARSPVARRTGVDATGKRDAPVVYLRDAGKRAAAPHQSERARKPSELYGRNGAKRVSLRIFATDSHNYYGVSCDAHLEHPRSGSKDDERAV